MGRDSFMVASTSRSSLTVGDERVVALKAANAHCEAMGKHAIIRRTTASNSFGGTTNELIFSCVADDDPEYRRPNLRPDPTVVIEDQRKPQ